MDEQETAMVKAEPKRDLLDVAPEEVKRKLENINKFQAVVQTSLHKDHDYGVIPGTQKPTLLKPGAEKIAKLMNLSDDYEIIEKVEDWEKGFFHYVIRCNLKEIDFGVLVSSGIGSCNSMENRYRWRWIPEWQLTEEQKAMREMAVFKEVPYRQKQGKFKSYRMPNDDIYTQVNTILKIAKKRALVDAALSAGRLSDLFTQDLEDIKEVGPEEPNEPPAAAPTPKPGGASDDQRMAVSQAFSKLVVLGEDPTQLEIRVIDFVKRQFKKQIKNVPTDLTPEMADRVVKNLNKLIADREMGGKEATL